MSDTDTARLYSHYLARHLDNGNLKPEILNPLLERPPTEADFTDYQITNEALKSRIRLAAERAAPLFAAHAPSLLKIA